jgi:hypothetical protein
MLHLEVTTIHAMLPTQPTPANHQLFRHCNILLGYANCLLNGKHAGCSAPNDMTTMNTIQTRPTQPLPAPVSILYIIWSCWITVFWLVLTSRSASTLHNSQWVLYSRPQQPTYWLPADISLSQDVAALLERKSLAD